MSEALKKILYVEDDDDIAEVVVMTLEDLGDFTVQHCSSGQAALSIISYFKPQLILMDVMMPNMDGTETYKYIKEMPEFAATPLIFMTAKAQLHEQKEYLDMGAISVIVKPFDPMALCGKLYTIWSDYQNEH